MGSRGHGARRKAQTCAVGGLVEAEIVAASEATEWDVVSSSECGCKFRYDGMPCEITTGVKLLGELGFTNNEGRPFSGVALRRRSPPAEAAFELRSSWASFVSR